MVGLSSGLSNQQSLNSSLIHVGTPISISALVVGLQDLLINIRLTLSIVPLMPVLVVLPFLSL